MVQQTEMWIVLAVIILLVVLLIWDKVRPHFIFFGATLLLMILGILEPKEFLNSFANQSIATIFILILLTAALNSNFNIVKYLDKLFTQKKKPRLFVFQMTTVVALMSSVMNNTPIVALLIPYIFRWSKKMKTSPSKLLIPLSFAAIAGGMITVIGTSTNLVLNGFIEANGGQPLQFSHYIIPGLLVSVTVVLFFSTFGYNLLKDRRNPLDTVKENLKEYLVELSIKSDSQDVGKTVEEAGLRNLQRVYLVEILRNGKVIAPVDRSEVLQSNDRLYFAGDTQDIVDLVKENMGFHFTKTEKFALDGDLELIETLIPFNSAFSGKTLKQLNFREKFDAAVVAIHRNGERLRGKLGDITLANGDILMITAGRKFKELSRNNSDLYTVKIMDQLGKPEKYKGIVLTIGFVVAVAAMISGFVPFFLGVLSLLALVFILRLMSEKSLKANFDIDLFIILGCSIAIGSAFISSGAAKFISDGITQNLMQYGNISLAIGIYVLTVILTSVVTNAAAVSIVFPIAFEMGKMINFPVDALYLLVAFGASCCFLTPFGYQTNLMVYGPGGYNFRDFFKVGLPITILYSVVCLSFLIIHYQIS